MLDVRPRPYDPRPLQCVTSRHSTLAMVRARRVVGQCEHADADRGPRPAASLSKLPPDGYIDVHRRNSADNAFRHPKELYQAAFQELMSWRSLP